MRHLPASIPFLPGLTARVSIAQPPLKQNAIAAQPPGPVEFRQGPYLQASPMKSSHFPQHLFTFRVTPRSSEMKGSLARKNPQVAVWNRTLLQPTPFPGMHYTKAVRRWSVCSNTLAVTLMYYSCYILLVRTLRTNKSYL